MLVNERGTSIGEVGGERLKERAVVVAKDYSYGEQQKDVWYRVREKPEEVMTEEKECEKEKEVEKLMINEDKVVEELETKGDEVAAAWPEDLEWEERIEYGMNEETQDEDEPDEEEQEVQEQEMSANQGMRR